MKSIAAYCLILLISLTSFQSQAVVAGGLYLYEVSQEDASYETAKTTAIVGGSISALGGVGLIVGSDAFLSMLGTAVMGKALIQVVGIVGGVISLGLGIVILEADEAGTITITYNFIDDQAANKIGLSNSQKDAYNQHVDDFNAIYSGIYASYTKESDTAQMWNDAYEVLKVPQEAQEALAIINSSDF
jgi:hypothetical protein